MPFALVQGEPLTVLPKDLYIPPEALEVFLEAFEGPLDLLLYLIKRQNLDILDIPVAEITQQYMSYIDLMDKMQFELAAEYLVMAAMLTEIKSRMLLPRANEVEDEEDPRTELMRRLQEYEQFKKAAADLDGLPRLERDIHLTQFTKVEHKEEVPDPNISLQDLILAFQDVVNRAEQFASHHVNAEPLSVRERMAQVLERVNADEFIHFRELFSAEEGKMGIVVSFLAILELIKASMIEIMQNEPFAPIYVKARA
ncbi:MAG: segregation/condensation protein A [Gammaproteobacteria bacterium]|nr:segregation/condensation protein A [Gammaproteobacteria bacterium]